MDVGHGFQGRAVPQAFGLEGRPGFGALCADALGRA
jgi:hypothetical protein